MSEWTVTPHSDYPMIVDDAENLRKRELVMRLTAIRIIAQEESRPLYGHEMATMKRYCDELDGTPTQTLAGL
jgi:hypothetical protein